MAKYYMLECYGPEDADRASIDTVLPKGVNWMLGRRFDPPLARPIRVTLNAGGGLMMPMFNRGILLMTEDLLTALAEAGVDNLERYDAIVVDPDDGREYTNYRAVNIIGVVGAADLARSKAQVHGRPVVDVDFDSLAIDEAKARGLLMFRLAECVSGIVAHEKIREHVQRKGIEHLDWVQPEDWVG